MKKKNFLKGCAITLCALLSLLYACQKGTVTPSKTDPLAATTAEITTSSLNSVVPLETHACGTPTTVPLRDITDAPGQWEAITYPQVGTVTISNDETNLYVRYESTVPLQVFRLFVGNTGEIASSDGDGGINIPENPPYGHYYKSPTFGGKDKQTTYTFTIPISEIKPAEGDCLYIMATANEPGKSKYWAVGTAFSGPTPAYFVAYCLQPCETSGVCYDNETAWAAGTRYVKKGNWATYTAYVADKQVTLYAGQTMPAGTVMFSAPDLDGNITITITLASGWSLTSDNESVKIQGYNAVPPASNPAPGLFTTYKGNALTTTVPKFAYYGIHLDVRRVVPCQ